MARVEFGSRVFNHSSKPITATRYAKNNNAYFHSCITSTNLSKSESEILKIHNNVDLSWLPNFDDNDNSASVSHHQHGENEFDYSWLPDHIDTNRIISSAASQSSNSKNSRFPSTYTVTKGNQSKETINNNNNNNNNKHKKPKKQELVVSSDQQIQPLDKKPESCRSQGQVCPSKSNCGSVETDSLGGVSTLRRRFQDIVETHKKTISPPGSPASFFDASDGVVENDKIRVVELAAGNKNELFARICKTWDQKQVAGDKTRLIRGRKACKDFLNLMGQDKQHELESLAHRKPVSRFPHRERIKALLRDRLIELDATNDEELDSTVVNEVMYEAHEIDDDIELENFQDCSSEYSQSHSDWDEQERKLEEEEEEEWDMQPFHDWTSNIARPRSYWECLRQARYKEMLHLCSYKQDILLLLQRRSVTGFLSSDARDNIDRLMMSRVQGIELRKEGMEGEQDEDDESEIDRKYREYNEFIDQRPSSIVSCC